MIREREQRTCASSSSSRSTPTARLAPESGEMRPCWQMAMTKLSKVVEELKEGRSVLAQDGSEEEGLTRPPPSHHRHVLKTSYSGPAAGLRRGRSRTAGTRPLVGVEKREEYNSRFHRHPLQVRACLPRVLKVEEAAGVIFDQYSLFDEKVDRDDAPFHRGTPRSPCLPSSIAQKS